MMLDTNTSIYFFHIYKNAWGLTKWHRRNYVMFMKCYRAQMELVFIIPYSPRPDLFVSYEVQDGRSSSTHYKAVPFFGILLCHIEHHDDHVVTTGTECDLRYWSFNGEFISLVPAESSSTVKLLISMQGWKQWYCSSIIVLFAHISLRFLQFLHY